MRFLARDASRLLQKLTGDERKTIINRMASNLITYSKDILQANKLDLEEASKGGSLETSSIYLLVFFSFFRSQIIITCSIRPFGKEITNSIGRFIANCKQS